MHKGPILVVLGAFVVLVGATGCGGGSPKRLTPTDAGTDAAGGSGGEEAGSSDATGGDLATDEPIDTSSLSDAADDLAGDAPSEAADAIDAGADCLAPTGEAALVPATEGVPADGLVLWLRGDRGVYKTAAQAVCAWADQSANQFLLTSGQTRPVWTAAGVGTQPAIHFGAAGQQLGMSGVLGLAPTSARTFVAVSILVQTTQRFQSIWQGQSGSPGTYVGVDQNTFNTAGSREGVYAMNNAYDAILATAPVPRIHVYTLPTMTPGTPILPVIDYRVNGAIQTLTRNPGGLGNGNFEDFSGANFTIVGSGAEGIVAEVLVYNRALVVDERVAIETALKNRYGIQ
ncbi:MAG TPA: hypothetical protein VGL59_00515 [Polyangia bacterium]